MRCPYQTITTDRDEKHEDGKWYHEQFTQFGVCVGSKCPFYRTRKEHNKHYPWTVQGRCKRAEKEMR